MTALVTHFTRHATAVAVALALVGCSHDSTGLTPGGSPSTASSGTAPSDTVTVVPHGEWHLQTVHGVLLGLERSTTGDTSAANTTPVANAKVEIHKISLAMSPPSDLGVVATKTTDAAGRFEYVLDDPIVVKTGEPTPLITYRLTVTPPAGSPFAGQSGMQVYFAEQLTGDGVVHYYLFRSKS